MPTKDVRKSSFGGKGGVVGAGEGGDLVGGRLAVHAGNRHGLFQDLRKIFESERSREKVAW